MKKILILSTILLVAGTFVDVVRASPGNSDPFTSKNDEKITVVNDDFTVSSFEYKNFDAVGADVFVLENENYSFVITPVKKTIEGEKKVINDVFETGIGITTIMNSYSDILFTTRIKKDSIKKFKAWLSEIKPVDYERESITITV